ncbi:MAG: hypothetical protein ACE3JQ_03285 [Paenisporosarcina sp.]
MSKDSRIVTQSSKVSKMLLEQKHWRILGNVSWVFPLQIAEVNMKTVVRSQMDVLMKMILMILQRLEVKQPSEISELLAVETIFVEHMLELMMHNKMVEKIDTSYQLTPSGLEHLKQGTFAHDPMDEQVELAYSPYHNEVLNRDHDQSILEEEEYVPDYTFEKDVNLVDITEIEDSKIRQMIEETGYEFIVEKGQKLIDEILSIEMKESLRAVCLEFHLHDRTEDTVFIRVWNTWTGQFDKQFEDELNQKKASKLRDMYKM